MPKVNLGSPSPTKMINPPLAKRRGRDFEGVVVLFEFYPVSVEKAFAPKEDRNVSVDEYDRSLERVHLMFDLEGEVANEAVYRVHRDA